MKTKSLIFACYLILTAISAGVAGAQDLYDYKISREAVDWCNITIKTKRTNEPDLPLVLLVGDSITMRYSREVTAALNGKAYVSVLATSKAVGDPALLDELKLVLRQNRYTVVHFNFGLHGGVEGFREGFAEVVATIQRHAPNAKLVWATTTPCFQKDGGEDKAVMTRNQIAAEHISKAGIATNDLYALVANHPQPLWDGGGVHYTGEGTALQSGQVAQIIEPLLGAVPKR